MKDKILYIIFIVLIAFCILGSTNNNLDHRRYQISASDVWFGAWVIDTYTGEVRLVKFHQHRNEFKKYPTYKWNKNKG